MSNYKRGRIKLPIALKSFLYCYIGGYPILIHFIEDNNTPLIFNVLLLTIGSFFFSYGVVSFVLDVKIGGLLKVLRKIKDFINI